MRAARALLSSAAVFVILIPALAATMRSDVRAVRVMRAKWRNATLLDDAGLTLQATRTDCGQTALRYALGIMRLPVRSPSLLASRPVGLSVDDLVELSLAEGVCARPLRTGVDSLDTVPLPAIALLGTHYVTVAERQSRDRFLVLDPSEGRLLVSRAYLAQDWRGVILVFLPGGSLVSQPVRGPQKSYWR